MPKENRTSKSGLIAKIFIILVVLIGLAVNVFLATTSSRLASSEAAAVEIFFSPESANLPPNTLFKYLVDPKSQGVSYIKTAISFDPNILRLDSAPIIGNSNLSLYRQVTSVSEANSTGIVEITLIRRPGGNVPTSTFEVFTLPMTFLNTAPTTSTYINVVDELTQIVSTDAQELPFTIKTAKINVTGRGALGKGVGAIFRNNQRGNCSSDDYIDTAIGCIPVNDEQALAAFLLAWGMGIGGGIALLMIGFASYKIMTSEGDPQKLKSGKDLLYAAISGLGLLVFAAFILRFVGVDVLGVF